MTIDTFLDKLYEHEIKFEIKDESIRDSSGYCPIACLWLAKNEDKRHIDSEYLNFSAMDLAQDLGLSEDDAKNIIFAADHECGKNSTRNKLLELLVKEEKQEAIPLES